MIGGGSTYFFYPLTRSKKCTPLKYYLVKLHKFTNFDIVNFVEFVISLFHFLGLQDIWKCILSVKNVCATFSFGDYPNKIIKKKSLCLLYSCSRK